MAVKIKALLALRTQVTELTLWKEAHSLLWFQHASSPFSKGYDSQLYPEAGLG